MTILQAIEQREQGYIDRIAFLEAEVKYWKDRWWADVYASIQHNHEMYDLVLKAALEGLSQREGK